MANAGSAVSFRPGPEDAIPHLVSIVADVEGDVLFVTCIDTEGRVGESECFVSATQPLAQLPLEEVFHLPKQLGSPAVMLTSRSNGNGEIAHADVDLAQNLILEGKSHGVRVYEHILVENKDSYYRLSQTTDLWS
jgi:hypothetical protein